MKKNNKGFSLVELIIVIAIMAILAGALAPALIKYINKSRRSADISNADTIRSAIQTALSNEEAADVLSTPLQKVDIETVKSGYGSFGSAVKEILGSSVLKTKYYHKNGSFFVDVDMSTNTVIVYGGGTAASDQLSPQP